MNLVNEENNHIYEGDEPYIFISYSHKDTLEMEKVRKIFDAKKVRYWYDDGLHSGDDWNMVIAKSLRNAAICLLLLSPNSATSDYVKNELNFAMNRRIPIHTLLLKRFELPEDIEMMTGRIQMIEMREDYGTELLKSFPAEIFYGIGKGNAGIYNHTFYKICNRIADRQGTVIMSAEHKKLKYPCTVEKDVIKTEEYYDAEHLSMVAAEIKHELFPRVYDMLILDNQMWLYQDFVIEGLLEKYLEENALNETVIIKWITSVIDGMEYLYKKNYALRDFARGSLVVREDGRIGICRLQNLHYGLISLNIETKNYYFEKVIQEIAILLVYLCERKIPSMPIQILDTKGFSKKFLERINLIVQKSAKVNGHIMYTDFAQMKEDLLQEKICLRDKFFLKKRAKELEKYDHAKRELTYKFTPDAQGEIRVPYPKTIPQMPEIATKRGSNGFGFSKMEVQIGENLEKQFGFAETVVLGQNEIGDCAVGSKSIRLMFCSTGQILEFTKDRVVIGKEHSRCDMVLTQPYVSRVHAIIERIDDRRYIVRDNFSTNGLYVQPKGREEIRLTGQNTAEITNGDYLRIGETKLQLL